MEENTIITKKDKPYTIYDDVCMIAFIICLATFFLPLLSIQMPHIGIETNTFTVLSLIDFTAKSKINDIEIYLILVPFFLMLASFAPIILKAEKTKIILSISAFIFMLVVTFGFKEYFISSLTGGVSDMFGDSIGEFLGQTLDNAINFEIGVWLFLASCLAFITSSVIGITNENRFTPTKPDKHQTEFAKIMIKCRECGELASEGSKFCNNCGKPL